MKRDRLPLRAGDFVVFAGILLLIAGTGILFLFHRTEQKRCVILQNNQVIEEIPLDGSIHRELILDGEYRNRIEIDGTRIRFASSTCPNQFCVHTGWISEPYQSAVCLPNRVIVRIESDRETEIDALT